MSWNKNQSWISVIWRQDTHTHKRYKMTMNTHTYTHTHTHTHTHTPVTDSSTKFSTIRCGSKNQKIFNFSYYWFLSSQLEFTCNLLNFYMFNFSVLIFQISQLTYCFKVGIPVFHWKVVLKQSCRQCVSELSSERIFQCAYDKVAMVTISHSLIFSRSSSSSQYIVEPSHVCTQVSLVGVPWVTMHRWTWQGCIREPKDKREKTTDRLTAYLAISLTPVPYPLHRWAWVVPCWDCACNVMFI